MGANESQKNGDESKNSAGSNDSAVCRQFSVKDDCLNKKSIYFWQISWFYLFLFMITRVRSDKSQKYPSDFERKTMKILSSAGRINTNPVVCACLQLLAVKQNGKAS